MTEAQQDESTISTPEDDRNTQKRLMEEKRKKKYLMCLHIERHFIPQTDKLSENILMII